MEEEEEEGEEELRIPGSFDFGDQGGGAGCETPGAGTVDPIRCRRYARELVAADAGEMTLCARIPPI